ncbi:SusC/RagA family TonB-linked outer membrane protein [Danxiaibacter flavus]|uniref:SusC/RagA family TonB-linked outer membrane protein n=1 Tax=Danxiaibacter flavus TaxID=3049108 RepID=A0ABV3ZHT7_9BACT|nr:SusC/RagA family TonB-linked outer membrane protein [Chitinophagaceae bacterium DXS]
MRKQLKLLPSMLMLIGLFFAISVFAQNQKISGQVKDEKGLPVPFATIQEQGTKNAVTADDNGNFTINVKEGGHLIISAIGYGKVTVSASQASSITLTNQTGDLSEVVVTALGIKREKRMLNYTTQEVKGSALVDAKQENIVNGLSGKVAGVQITNSTGQPGSSSQIIIRGNSTLLGNNGALFVIDGIPMDNSEAGNPDGALGAGGTSNRGIDIDPNIIESVNVLKGAAATAIYGSSASRGAVIITTKNGKSGKSGKPTVSVSSSYTVSKALLPELQSTWAQGSGGRYVDGNNGQLGSASWGPEIDTLRVNGQPVPKHNQLKEFYRTGHVTDNNVSVSGSNDRSNYLASYSFLRNDGITPTTNYIRNAFFAKYDTKLGNKVNLTTQFNYIHADNNRTLDGNSLEAPLWTVLGSPISWNPKPSTRADGSQNIYRAARNNPYWLLENTGLLDKVDRIIPVVNLSYSPTSWLTITERLGGDMYYNTTDYHEAIGTVGSYPTGRVYNRAITYQQFNNDIIVDARKNFGSDFFGEILLGNNILTNFNDNKFDQGVGLGVPGFYNISNATTVTSSYSSYKNRKVGFYGQINTEYKKMLTLSLTGRYDGSSVLSVNNQFYPYGSVSAGFIFTEALGMSQNKIFNFGKIRAAYSVVGADNVAPYSLTNPYIQASVGNVTFPFAGQNGYLLTTTYGYPLKNETVKELEIGLETKFFDSRVSLDVTYFNKKSIDLLTSGVPIEPATGFTGASLNSGSMRNKGVEVTLGVTPIRTKDLTWNIGINYTKIKNDVLNLAPGITFLQFAGFTNPGIFAFANSPYGVIYGTHFKRNDGGRLLLDDDGYPQLADDLGPIGNVTPNWLGGLTSDLTYKNFTFSFVLDMKQGGQILNLDGHYLDFYGTSKVTENRNGTKVFNGIIESTGKENTAAVKTDQIFYQNLYSVTDETSVSDASFLKLRQVSLGYRLGSSILKNSFFKSIAINVTGTNFILHKNYFGADPEVSLNGSGNGQGLANFMTPTSKNFIVGLKATF